VEEFNKKSMDPNILYDYIWTKEELDPYRKMYVDWRGEQSDPRRGDREVWIIDENYPNPNKVTDAYRDHLPPLVKTQFMKSLNQGFSVDNKLSKYSERQQYDWHCDASITWRNPKCDAWRRIISSITYLNDDYEGGETEFLNDKITPVSGKTVVFPSSYMYPHRGCPVTKGVKKIMVMHFWI